MGAGCKEGKYGIFIKFVAVRRSIQIVLATIVKILVRSSRLNKRLSGLHFSCALSRCSEPNQV